MKPMFDDLEIPDSNLELPFAQEIAIYDLRVLAEHKPPGMSGSLLQNMGRRPTRIALRGVVAGPDALYFVEKLDEKFRAAKPLSFTADIAADSEIDEMVIEDLLWQELAGKPERFAYVLILREYIEPIEPEDTSLLEENISNQAKDLMNDLVEGLDVGLDFLADLERFVSPLSDLLGRLDEFNKLTNR